ncbi:hypothetical protein HAX54_001982 [Datura stramonium]|uniref:Uncharacterized protein n=1 Tax=Datura stramonium TaxID=4076 RepID=A0ABS8T4A3_DATST|nr:hypothetical protein [Datura stramonium]
MGRVEAPNIGTPRTRDATLDPVIRGMRQSNERTGHCSGQAAQGLARRNLSAANPGVTAGSKASARDKTHRFWRIWSRDTRMSYRHREPRTH